MGLEWMPRDDGIKDHSRFGSEHWGTEAPCVVYEKKPLIDPKGNEVPGLSVAWIRLNNPAQYNSYTTEMVKGVIAAFENSSVDRDVVAVVFTATGPFAFCTGGNTKEEHGPPKKGEQQRSVISHEKAKKLLIWQPETTLKEGLKQTVAFFKENRK